MTWCRRSRRSLQPSALLDYLPPSGQNAKKTRFSVRSSSCHRLTCTQGGEKEEEKEEERSKSIRTSWKIFFFPRLIHQVWGKDSNQYVSWIAAVSHRKRCSLCTRHLLPSGVLTASPPGGWRTHLSSMLLTGGERTLNALQRNADQRQSGVKAKHADGLERGRNLNLRSPFTLGFYFYSSLLHLHFMLSVGRNSLCII